MRITDLEAGVAYVVRQSFRDDAGTLVLPGDRMTFERYRAVPVTGAFEVTFREETLVLHEDLLWVCYYSSHEDQSNIYLAQIETD